jgi:putative transposase
MPRPEIAFQPGEYYHLYNRGVNRERIFFEPENYIFFLRRLREHLVPVLEVVAYCLMPPHYHLPVQVKEAQTSQTSEVSAEVPAAMMRLTVSYTKAVNKRYERVGPLFQGAFQARHVERDEYLVHLSRYIHLNPWVAGYVGHAEEWEYSSYPDYLGLRQGGLADSGCGARPILVPERVPAVCGRAGVRGRGAHCQVAVRLDARPLRFGR